MSAAQFFVRQDAGRSGCVRAVAGALGVSDVEALGLLVCLFAGVARHAPRASAFDVGPHRLAAFAGWDGSAQAFAAAVADACCEPDGVWRRDLPFRWGC